MFAMSHSIQNRIAQAMCRGRMSEGVAEEIKSMTKILAIDAYQVSQMSKEEKS